MTLAADGTVLTFCGLCNRKIFLVMDQSYSNVFHNLEVTKVYITDK